MHTEVPNYDDDDDDGDVDDDNASDFNDDDADDLTKDNWGCADVLAPDGGRGGLDPTHGVLIDPVRGGGVPESWISQIPLGRYCTGGKRCLQ